MKTEYPALDKEGYNSRIPIHLYYISASHLQHGGGTQEYELTTLNFNCAVLRVERVVVKVHHAGEGGGEPHPISDTAITIQSNQLVPLRHIMQKTEISN